MTQPMEQQAHALKPTNRAIFKVLKDIRLRQCRSEQHLLLINKAIDDGVVLNGLRRDVRPQIPDQPIDLTIQWEQAHLDFGLRLQTLLKEYWTEKILTYRNDIADTLSRIPNVNDTPDTAEVAFITDQLNELAVKEAARLLAPKPQAVWNRRRRMPQTKRRRDQTVASSVERSGTE